MPSDKEKGEGEDEYIFCTAGNEPNVLLSTNGVSVPRLKCV